MRLLRLPFAIVRIPVELGLEIARRAGGAAVSAVRGPAGDAGGTAVRVPAEPRFYRPQPPVRPRPARRAPANGGVPPAPPEPTHVSEEPVLVAEVAEEGAEEGAGPETRVLEPWPGYGRMTAAEIVGRLRGETAEVAAAVSLYEASRKGRRSVLEAAAAGLR
jgi:hypothetical protein